MPAGVGQPGVKPVRAVGVVPQRPDRVGQEAARADRLADLVAVDRGLRREPRRVRRQVHAERDQRQRVDRRADVTPQRAHPRSRHAVLPARGDVERQRHQPEEHDEVQARPLCRTGQSEQHARAEPPPPHAEPRAPRRLADAALEQGDVHPFPHLVAVDDQRAERRHHEERQKAVEQRGARRDEVDSVGDEQQAGDRADHRRPGDPTDDAGHQWRSR